MNQVIETRLDEFRAFTEQRFVARVQVVAPELAGLVKFDNVEIGDLKLERFLRFALVEGKPIGANLNVHQRIIRIPGRAQIDFYVKRGEGSGVALRTNERLAEVFSLQDLSVAPRHSVKFKYANTVPIGVKDRWFVVQSTIMYLRDVHQA